MGIKGLLPVLKPISKNVEISRFSGMRIGVDAYVWLHRGAIGCATQLCTTGSASQYVSYVLHRVKLLLHHKVVPVLVFDGADLPMKAQENRERRQRRQAAIKNGHDALANGNKKLAETEFQKAVEVTPDMAHMVIRQLRKMNVGFVVAPYEADAQLAAMAMAGEIDGVITEDSDLIAYGAERIIYKLNKFGEGQLVMSKDLGAIEDPCMRRFTPDMLLWTCVLAGCDFFAGVDGLGIRKGHAIVKRYRRLPRILNFVTFNRKYNVSDSFTIDFHRACLVFRHQMIYDKKSKSLSHLKPLEEINRSDLPSEVFGKYGDDYDFLGPRMNPIQAQKIAEGLIHPTSLQEFEIPLDDIQRPLGSLLDRRARSSKDRTSNQKRGKKGPILFKVKQVSSNAELGKTLSQMYSSKSVQKPFRRPRRVTLRSTLGSQAEDERQEGNYEKSSGIPAAVSKWMLSKRPADVAEDAVETASSPPNQSDRNTKVSHEDMDCSQATSEPRISLSVGTEGASKEAKHVKKLKRRGSLSLRDYGRSTARSGTPKVKKTISKKPALSSKRMESFWKKRDEQLPPEELEIPNPPSPPSDLDVEMSLDYVEDEPVAEATTENLFGTSEGLKDDEDAYIGISHEDYEDKPSTLDEQTPVDVQKSTYVFNGKILRSRFLKGNGSERITLRSPLHQARAGKCRGIGEGTVTPETPNDHVRGHRKMKESTLQILERFRRKENA